jgi:hypothetical protein
MEAICSSETSVETQQTTRRYIPEDGTLHNHRCDNLKSYMLRDGILAYSLTPKMEATCYSETWADFQRTT